MTAAEVVIDVDALIISIPLNAIPGIRPLVDQLPDGTVVLDNSNYYPMRDGHIPAIDDGQVESLWVAEQLGRSVIKAWNAILANSFATKNAPVGSPDRIAIPLPADSRTDRELGMKLVKETGFDAVDAGTPAESWRQQPGAPAYCTRDELPAALAAANAIRTPRRRDLAMSVVMEPTQDPTGDIDPDFGVRVNRLIYM